MNELDIVPAESLAPMPDSTPPDLEAEGRQLRAQAEKADLGETTPEQEKDAPETDKSEDSTQNDQQRAADAEQKTEATKSDSPEASAEPKSSYQARRAERDKAQREQERQKSVLANFEQEKQRERAAIAQERQELRQMFQKLQQQQAQPRQQAPRFNSQHLVQAEKEFEATAIKALQEGDTESAQKHMDLASKARVAAQESYFAEQQEAYAGAFKQHETAWRSNASAVIQAHPELADPSTEQARAMQELLQSEPLFGEVPNGFQRAYELLELRKGAAEASGLKEKVASLEKQLKDLQERTGLNGSGPMPRSDRRIEDMSLEEQGAALRRQVADADRLSYA